MWARISLDTRFPGIEGKPGVTSKMTNRLSRKKPKKKVSRILQTSVVSLCLSTFQPSLKRSFLTLTRYSSLPSSGTLFTRYQLPFELIIFYRHSGNPASLQIDEKNTSAPLKEKKKLRTGLCANFGN